MKRSRGGLVFKAHRLVCHSTLGWRVIKKKNKKKRDNVEGYQDLDLKARTRFRPRLSYIHTSPQRRTGQKGLLGVCTTNRTRSPLRGLRCNVTKLLRPFILLKCVILFAYLDLCGCAAFAQERSHTLLPLHVEDDPLAGRLPCDFAISGSLSTHPSWERTTFCVSWNLILQNVFIS